MNPCRKTGGTQLLAWAVFAGLFAISAPLLAIDTDTAAKRKPADWVAQLGSEKFAEREEASAALLALGAAAREAVHGALNAKDPEVETRARELWKTLRWDVVPGAEKETAKLAIDSAGLVVDGTRGDNPGQADDEDRSALDEDAWKAFVKKYGVPAWRLVAEFRASGLSAKTYRAGMIALLEYEAADDLVRYIKQQPEKQRAALGAPLATIYSGSVDPKGEVAVVLLRAELHQYDQAYDFARTGVLDSGGTDEEVLIAAFANVVKSAGMIDKAETEGLNDVADETDPEKLCLKLDFHVGIMADLGEKDRIARLSDAAKVDPGVSSSWGLITFVQELMVAGLPDRVLKILRNAKESYMLYMRSHAHAALNDTAAADADWKAAQAAADAIPDAGKRKGAYFMIGKLMYGWGDPQAESLFLRVIAMPPKDEGTDSNAYFAVSQIYENRKQYQRAVEYYQKAMDSFAKSGALMSIIHEDGSRPDDGVQAMHEDFDRLKALADGQKPGASASPSPAPP